MRSPRPGLVLSFSVMAVAAVMLACARDPTPAPEAAPDSGQSPAPAPTAPPPTPASAPDAGVFTGCTRSNDTSCLCGGWSDGFTQCSDSSYGGAICRQFACYCTCDAYTCAPTSTGCECGFDSDNPIPSCRLGGGVADAGAAHAGTNGNADASAGICCASKKGYCQCDRTSTKCYLDLVPVPTCDLVDARPKFAEELFVADDRGTLVDSCNNLLGRAPDDASCKPTDTGCKKTGCGIPLECAPGVRCCNPTCDLATDHCVLKCN